MPAPAVPAPPLELMPVDIAPYAAGNTGVPYVTRFDSGRAGPHLLVTALVHGNELCGAHALRFLFDGAVRPRRGILTLAFANPAAYRRFDLADPSASRCVDEDLNRLWSPQVLDRPGQSLEHARARALRPIAEAADYLLDLHSMQQDSPPLILCGTREKGRQLAAAVGYPGTVVADAGHRAGHRLRDYGAFDDPNSPRAALLVECGQHWKRASADVAIQTVLRFLRHFDVIDRDFADAHLGSPPPRQRLIEVTAPHTALTPEFSFVAPYRGLEVIPRAGTVIGHDGARVVRTPYDDCVLVMPSQRVKPGQTAVRFGRFVN